MIQSINIDPRTRIIISLCLTFCAVLWNRTGVLLPVFLLSCIAGVMLGKAGVDILFRLRKLLVFFVFIAFVQSIFIKAGAPLLILNGHTILTMVGIDRGLCFLLRMGIITASGAVITAAGQREVLQALIESKIPYEIAFMVTITLSFIPILSEDMRNYLISAELRGIEIKKLPFHSRIKVYSYIITTVIEGLIVKARELSCAMEMRAFGAYKTRSSYVRLNIKSTDYLIITVFAVLLLLILVFNYYRL